MEICSPEHLCLERVGHCSLLLRPDFFKQTRLCKQNQSLFTYCLFLQLSVILGTNMLLMYAGGQTRYCRPYCAKRSPPPPPHLNIHTAHTVRSTHCGQNGSVKTASKASRCVDYTALEFLRSTLLCWKLQETEEVDGWCIRHLEPVSIIMVVTIEAPLKSFNMKQSSESWVCTLYVTRDCVMPFNPHEYKYFKLREHIQPGNGLRGGEGAFLQLTIRG